MRNKYNNFHTVIVIMYFLAGLSLLFYNVYQVAKFFCWETRSVKTAYPQSQTNNRTVKLVSKITAGRP